jgi:hypothetical protein
LWDSPFCRLVGLVHLPTNFLNGAEMKDFERVCRKFWVFDKHDVKYVEGYSCDPPNADYWWFPSLGFSINRSKFTKFTPAIVKNASYSIFDNKRDALINAIANFKKLIEDKLDLLDKLEVELKEEEDRINADQK